ncbi:MAG: DUF4349 domain-containing protein [Hamadaea sp.]|nr:DUF4349 domain-containing protein [Hamadaea sp.]
MVVRARTALLATAGIVLALAAGCASNDNAKSTSGADGGAPAAAPAGEKAGVQDLSAGQGQGSGTTGQGSGQAPEVGRAMIYTGTMTVRVDDVTASAEKVRTLANGQGGFVGSEKSSSRDSEESSTITIRVPADKFDGVLTDLGKLGEELDRQVTTEDVTAAVVDLEARIKAQQASVDSVRRMFTQAKQLSEVVQLEAELTKRQAELDALLAKQRRLDDLVQLCTITVTLVGPNTDYQPKEDEDPSFLGGLKAGWNTFLFILRVAAAVIGFVLPFAVVAAIVVVPLWFWLRRRRALPPPPTDEA